MSLTIESIVAQKGDISLPEEPQCGISQVKSQVEEKVCASSEKARCDKSQSQIRASWEREIAFIERLNKLSRVKRNLGCYRT